MPGLEESGYLAKGGSKVRCQRCGDNNVEGAATCKKCDARLIASSSVSPTEGAESFFVGRISEMNTLRGALERVLHANAKVIALAGDPGIGKTCTCIQIAREAKRRGASVIWARGYEEPGAPPYWPWVQIVRGLLENQPAQAVQAMGESAGFIAAIVPEVNSLIPKLPRPTPISDAGQARFRLFDEITIFLKRIAEVQPLVLVFDNIHLADESSLRLLEFFAAGIETSRVLGLVTFRDFDLDRHHPLSNTLAELSRHDYFQRVRLTGLDHLETRQVMEGAMSADISPKLVRAVHEQTEGNPLFVVEMARYLAQESVLPRRDTGTFNDEVAAALTLKIPRGVREVIGLRLSQLSPQASKVLSNAAVIGRTFHANVLRRLLSELSDDVLDEALEEALSVHVIDELDAAHWYQFSHALIRETLYDEIPRLRRLRLHTRIGTVIEAVYQGNIEPHLSLLAYHYSAAFSVENAQKAVDYALRAGEQAEALLAYEEAARNFGMALTTIAQLGLDDPGRRCRTEIRLGIAQTKSGESLAALKTLAQAATKAKELGAAEELAQAAIAFEEANWRPGLPGKSAVQLLEDALAMVPTSNSALRVRLQASLSRALTLTGAPDLAAQVSHDAIVLARQTADSTALAAALSTSFWLPWDPNRIAQRLSWADEAIELSRQTGNTEKLLECGTFQLFYLMVLGETRACARELAEYVLLANKFRQRFYQYHFTSVSAALAVFEGRFDEGEKQARAALDMSAGLAGLDGPGIYGIQMFMMARERGQLKQLAPLIKHFSQSTSAAATWLPALALAYAEIDQLDDARTLFDSLSQGDFRSVPRDSLWQTCLTYLSIVCWRLQNAERARFLYHCLLPSAGLNIVTGSTILCCGPTDLYLGMLATTYGDLPAAEQHFSAAAQACAAQGGRPWLAHSQMHWAALLVSRGQGSDPEQALELIENALETCKVLNMPALAERITSLKRQAESQTVRPSYPAGLSHREVEVVRLIAAGKSNQEIALALFRSPNTVANHVRNILAKINAANRSEAAAFAAQHGLLEQSGRKTYPSDS
jgi:DNA-binding CsgD family transcriptional regulator